MMTHPFLTDLSGMSLEDLQNKMGELTKHLNFAYRMQNSSMIHQLQMVMQSYQQAYHAKMDESLNKQNANDKIKVGK